MWLEHHSHWKVLQSCHYHLLISAPTTDRLAHCLGFRHTGFLTLPGIGLGTGVRLPLPPRWHTRMSGSWRRLRPPPRLRAWETCPDGLQSQDSVNKEVASRSTVSKHQGVPTSLDESTVMFSGRNFPCKSASQKSLPMTYCCSGPGGGGGGGGIE